MLLSQLQREFSREIKELFYKKFNCVVRARNGWPFEIGSAIIAPISNTKLILEYL